MRGALESCSKCSAAWVVSLRSCEELRGPERQAESSGGRDKQMGGNRPIKKKGEEMMQRDRGTDP